MKYVDTKIYKESCQEVYKNYSALGLKIFIKKCQIKNLQKFFHTIITTTMNQDLSWDMQG
jgi:hypothetical protein